MLYPPAVGVIPDTCHKLRRVACTYHPGTYPHRNTFSHPPPLSDTEKKSEEVALEFVQAVLFGRDQAAHAFLAPTYIAGNSSLLHVLGIAETLDSYALVADQRVPNGVVFRLLLYYPKGVRIGHITLEQVQGKWLVTSIDRAR